MRALGYVRVSTDKQADNGCSLDAQTAKIRQYASLYDLELVDIVVDAGESAKSLHRPGLQKALQALKSGKAECLIVVKLDRLTRSVKDLGYLIETYFSKYALMSVGEQVDTRSAAGRLVLNVLMSVAQWEREAIGERTKDALRHKKQTGKKTGGYTPFGYSAASDGTLVENADEMPIVRRVQRYQAEGLSVRKIANQLALDGITNRRGQPLHFTQVQRILKAV